jgi:Na+/proline symporter
MMFHWLDVLVLAAYFVIIIGTGICAARKIKGVNDYYMGSRRFGKAMMIMYAFGAGTHADSAVGVVAQSYKFGMAGVWYQWMQIFNTPFYWLLVAVFRRARCLTTGDFYEMRYGPSMGILYGFMGVGINIGFMGVMLLGSGRLIEALSGGAVSLRWAVVLMPCLFLFYSLLGGLIAAVWNDFLQGILTIIMSLMLVPFLLIALGGISGVQAKAPNVNDLFRLTAPGEIGLFWIIAAAINQMFSVPAQPHIMSNAGAGKTELDNRIGFSVGVTLKRFCSIAWALVGVLAIVYYGPRTMNGDHVFGALVRDLLPAGFAGLMVACILASVMNTGSVFVLSTSALFTRNLLRMFRDAEHKERLEILASRLFSLVFVGASVTLALSFGDVPSAIRFIWIFIPLIGISFWLGLWWRRANRYGAWASFITALVAWIVGVEIFGWTGDRGLPYLITFYLGSGITAGAIVSLITPPETEELLDRFYLTINTPIGQESRLERFAARTVEVSR